MPNSGYAFGDQPALDDIAHTDLLLDALAERERIDLDDPQVDALAVLMGARRDDLRWPPASALVSAEEAVEAMRTGLAERRRAHRGLAAIGSVAATLLVLSGFGAFVAEAHRGDPLYGLHVMFFDAPRVNDDTITLSAKADLAKVQQMIDQGQWAQAQNQLAEVSSTVQAIDRREQPAKPAGRGEPAEHQGGVAKPQCDVAARLAAIEESSGPRYEAEGFRGYFACDHSGSDQHTTDSGQLHRSESVFACALGPAPAPRPEHRPSGGAERWPLDGWVSDAGETRRRLTSPH